jgi:hypothetical protein
MCRVLNSLAKTRLMTAARNSAHVQSLQLIDLRAIPEVPLEDDPAVGCVDHLGIAGLM